MKKEGDKDRRLAGQYKFVLIVLVKLVAAPLNALGLIKAVVAAKIK